MNWELSLSKRDDLFAGTPPLEALRFVLFQRASNQGHRDRRHNFLVMTSDVSRAYFDAPATRPIHIAIPEEDKEAMRAWLGS